MKDQSITCTNTSCGRVVVNPLKAINVSSQNAKPYKACPYCLTEIALVKATTVAKEGERPEPEALEAAREGLSHAKEEPDTDSLKVEGCPHYLGYLSQRSKSEGIPEGCMACENIIKCMLKTLTN